MGSLQDARPSSGSSIQMTTGTGDTSAVVEATPPSTSAWVTSKKSTPSNGKGVTTHSTRASTRTSRAIDDTAANAATGSRSTDSTNRFTDEDAGDVSSTSASAVQLGRSLPSVTAVTSDSGVNSSMSATVAGGAGAGASTVTSNTPSDTNGSVNRSINSPNSVGNSAAAAATASREVPSPVSAAGMSSSSVPTPSSAVQPVQEPLVSSARMGGSTPRDLPVRSPASSGTSTNGNTAAASGTTTTDQSTSSYPNSEATTASQDTAPAVASGTEERESSVTGGPTSSMESIASTGNGKAASRAIGSSTPFFTTASSKGFSSGAPSEAQTLSSSASRSSSRSSIALKRWYDSIARENETQLIVGAKNSSSSAFHQVCNGQPALITQSSAETPNGGCPDELTALNASCTCLTGYSATAASWVFDVTSESWNSTSHGATRPLTQSASDKLKVTTIRPMWVSSRLETLKIDSSDESSALLTFVEDHRRGRTLSSPVLKLVRSKGNKSEVHLTTLSLTNVNLHTVAATTSDFVPATVTSLALRHCNISTLGSSFTRTWDGLEQLDLSSNTLSTYSFVGGPALKELNLSYNALAAFPVTALGSNALEALYLHGNNIQTFNVNQHEFDQIRALTAFTADPPATVSTSCANGTRQSAHGTAFCVLRASTAAAPDASQTPAGSASHDDYDILGALGYWFVAGAIAVLFVLLLVVWKRRRYSRERSSSPFVSPIAIEPTTPQCDLSIAFDDALNRDSVVEIAAPAIGAAAIAATAGVATIAAQVYPGYGQPHGNSIESEDTAAMDRLLANDTVLASCRLESSELQLGRCISRGGFGLVFVGSYRGRQVAVKKIRSEREVGCEQVQQFVREISLLSSLSHPRIVEFVGACWTTPAELSAVTELMERGDLRDVTRRFKRRGYRLTWSTYKVNIALHIAEALTYLHGLTPTVIHRDLKAKNVMLNADMEAKLSDFGIARTRSSGDGRKPMTAGIGTSFWIAPEVLLGQDYDERADIYSFGVVLSEIDTEDYPYWNAKHPPQGKAQEREILRQVARGAKRPSFSDDCPPAILELAARCLRTDPEKRPSALGIVLYLQQLLQFRNSSAPSSSMVCSSDGTKKSAPTGTGPDNTVASLRATASAAQQKKRVVTSSATAASADASGKQTKISSHSTRMEVTAGSGVRVSSAVSSRLHPAEALEASHEVTASSAQVTRHSIHTNVAAKAKTATTTTTTRSTTRRDTRASASGISEYFLTPAMAGSSDSLQPIRTCIDAVPTSLQASHQAATDTLASNGCGALQAEKRP